MALFELNKFEPFVAFRYLRSKRKEVFVSVITIISLLGVAISVMVLNIVLSVMTGFEEELQSKLIDANAHVTIRRFTGNLTYTPQLDEIVGSIPGVKSVYPFTYSQAMVKTQQGARGILVRGVPNETDSKEKLQKNLLEKESITSLYSKYPVDILRPDGLTEKVELPTIIIGEELQRRMGVEVGGLVTLLSPDFSSSPLGLMPRHRRFVVSGIYSSGLVEYEAGLIYMGIDEAKRFFDFEDKVSGVELSVVDRNNTALIIKSLETALEDYPDGLVLSDWTDQNKPLWEAIKLEKRVYFIVLLLLILVASFTIVATLVMVVMEKGRDIAIFKTMGASDSQILRIFMLQGGIIGFSGVLLGTVFGYLGCIALRTYGFPIDARVFSLDTVPVHMNVNNFLVVAVCGFVITSLVGLYPARRASRLVPAEALRFE